MKNIPLPQMIESINPLITPMPSLPTKAPIPSSLPPLPVSTTLPWSAEIIQAHRGLTSSFGISYRALNLDESDPIRLGHHLKQAETFMSSIVDALSLQEQNPLPTEYIESLEEAVELLVDGLRDALSQATLALVIPTVYTVKG